MKRVLSVILAVALLFTLTVTAFAAERKTEIGTVNTENGLVLREKATKYSPAVCIADAGDQVLILQKAGDWYQVRYGDHIGYMHSDFVTVDPDVSDHPETGTLLPWLTNLRSGTSTNASVIERIAAGEKVQILGLEEGWFHVQYGDASGYVRSDLIGLTDKYGKDYGCAVKPEAVTQAASFRLGNEIATYAMSFVGYPYVYGGSSPSGFDCSGFMQYLFRQYGISINRTATAQLADGYAVSYDEMQPGDIIYFGYGNVASHVGMYIGGGEFVHAENSGTGVVITSLSQSYYANRFLCAHRIVE